MVFTVTSQQEGWKLTQLELSCSSPSHVDLILLTVHGQLNQTLLSPSILCFVILSFSEMNIIYVIQQFEGDATNGTDATEKRDEGQR